LQAESQASILDVSLGELIASSDSVGDTNAGYVLNPTETSCAPVETQQSLLYPNSSPPFDPNEESMVTVRVSVELTFRMSDGMTATPAA
jgi:hypothetical protein